MKRQIPLTAVIAIALLIVAVAGYLALIRPKKAQGSELDGRITAVEAQIDAAAARPESKPAPEIRVRVADLVRLAKAMPDQADMAATLVELNTLAESSGVRFLSIQPQAEVVKGDYRALPILLTFEGSYYDLTELLYSMRSLVAVRDGELDASGRMFTLDAIDLHESQAKGFPEVEALLTVSTYAYGQGSGAAALTTPTPAGSATEGTDPASTAPTDTIVTESDGQSSTPDAGETQQTAEVP